MKLMSRHFLLVLTALGGMAVVGANAAEATALQLVKEGDRYVGEQSKNKVIQIRSEKSIAGTIPTIWYVVYLDPTARFKTVEVKFGAGKMLDVKRPVRMPSRGGPELLELSKVKIDSDEAIRKAIAEPLLEKIPVKATSARLERGEAGVPVWRIRIWAAKLRNPSAQVDLGELVLSAEDGKVIKNTLRINRVD